MKRFTAFLLALCLCIAFSGCAATSTASTVSANSDTSFTFTDALGREVTVNHPQRVAALIGSFADIWCLAGGKDTLVAAAGDTWTQFDLDLDQNTVTNLGSVKSIQMELLLAAAPDLVLASTNTAEQVAMQSAMEQAGLTVAYFDVSTFDDYLDMLNTCTQITGDTAAMETYGTTVQKQVEAALARATGEAPTVLYIRASSSGCKVKGSRDNVLGEMLSALGCVNIADSDSTLLENLSLEAILAQDPDDIFVVLQGTDDAARQALEAEVLNNPAWQQLTAVKEGRVYYMDQAWYNVKPNAHWGDAYEHLADILYGES